MLSVTLKIYWSFMWALSLKMPSLHCTFLWVKSNIFLTGIHAIGNFMWGKNILHSDFVWVQVAHSKEEVGLVDSICGSLVNDLCSSSNNNHNMSKVNTQYLTLDSFHFSSFSPHFSRVILKELSRKSLSENPSKLFSLHKEKKLDREG